MKIGGQTVKFMVDTGAEHSVVSQKERRSPLSELPGTRPVDCSATLTDANLAATKWGQRLSLPQVAPQLRLSEMISPIILSLAVPREEEWRLYTSKSEASPLEPELDEEFPLVWAEGNPPGLAKDHALVLIDLKPRAQPVKVCQYPVPTEACLGIQVRLDRLLQWGLHKRCQSPWNTPLLPVKKPGTDDYHLVQDLQAVNEAALPNPYTLLGLIPSEAEWFTCLDLKDAFFCLQLAPSSQPLFTFEWENPTTGAKEQFTWTRLPQGFKNSHTLFSGALASDLSSQDRTWDVFYSNNYLLLASSTRAQCWEGMRALLRLLTETGYQCPRKRQRFVRKKSTADLGILGAAGFCWIWTPGFSDLAKPLYEALKGEEKAPIDWGPEQEKAFITIKAKLTEAPALGLPDNSGVALGVLTQEFGPWQRPVAYLSKQINSVASRWPPCLRALAATVLLVKEGDKLALGQNLNYQGLLCENPWVRLEAVRTLNPATFLPVAEGAPEHDCLQVLEEVYSSRRALTDEPLQNLDLVLFTDGSSFLDERKRRARVCSGIKL
ncbi:LOW QUALITY PROTEIN: hypothetical protein QTO34_000409 [Cnephaeus nilssonii]|uniref:Peptidase A2 domain-containing protein n=1 Tax=Cnephaeus nilssonii TaxID=3371016 RepID=A0AA40IBC3_CNENI|nr:LOW QUALITY PROTEIN: hypothetical protein QTO34_000409 [Eptesicus nilssonii]